MFRLLPIRSEVEKVVYWMPEILFAAEIAFRGLHGCMPEQKLNLLELATAAVAQLRAGSPQVVREGIARDNPEMTKSTLHKLKSILSAIFKLAIQQEYRSGSNPMRETSLPRAQASAETVAYDLDQVLGMLRIVPEPSRTVIAVAEFTGLRRGEIEGLLWENYDGETLAVTRAMWRGIAGEPKTEKSKASVPVIPALRRFLDAHRLAAGNPQSGIIFKTRNSTPLAMNNLLNDQILPALNHCVCGLEKIEHGGADPITPVTRPVPSGTAFTLSAVGSRRTCTRSEWTI
jgi:integrase